MEVQENRGKDSRSIDIVKSEGLKNLERPFSGPRLSYLFFLRRSDPVSHSLFFNFFI